MPALWATTIALALLCLMLLGATVAQRRVLARERSANGDHQHTRERVEDIEQRLWRIERDLYPEEAQEG